MRLFGKNWLLGLQQLVCLRIIQALRPMKKVLQEFLCELVKEALIKTKMHILSGINIQNVYKQKISALP